MVEKQHTNRPCYKSPPPALILSRKRTLDWLCETGESLGISSECIHKSAVFFDRILSENMIEEAELQSIALMCLLLSCKLIEKDQETDKVKSLFRSRMGVRGYQLKQRETRVLTLLRWDLQCVTPLDFLEVFFSQGILFTNDRIRTASGNKQVNVKVAESLRKYAEFFAELCLQKHALLSVDSLHLAAGILAVSRKRMGLVDTWSKETEMLTGVKLSEIADCVETIERFYNRMFPGTRVSREANSRPAREARDTDKYFAKGRDKENLNNAWGYRTVRVPSALTMYSTADSGKYGKQW